MGFIKNALIGIAIYEVAKHLWKKDQFKDQALVHDLEINRRTRGKFFEDYPGDPLAAGSNPDVSLAGAPAVEDDPWKNSLANDNLRAPDS